LGSASTGTNKWCQEGTLIEWNLTSESSNLKLTAWNRWLSWELKDVISVTDTFSFAANVAPVYWDWRAGSHRNNWRCGWSDRSLRWYDYVFTFTDCNLKKGRRSVSVSVVSERQWCSLDSSSALPNVQYRGEKDIDPMECYPFVQPFGEERNQQMFDLGRRRSHQDR
jgi:hypothetical protein